MVDPQKLDAFVHQALGDLGATLTASLVVIGDKLGLYKAVAGAGPLGSVELAERTGTNERCVREWLAAQAAAGYVEYDASTGRYTLPPEQAVARNAFLLGRRRDVGIEGAGGTPVGPGSMDGVAERLLVAQLFEEPAAESAGDAR